MWGRAERNQVLKGHLLPPEESLPQAGPGVQGRALTRVSSYPASWPLRAQAPLAGPRKDLDHPAYHISDQEEDLEDQSCYPPYPQGACTCYRE